MINQYLRVNTPKNTVKEVRPRYSCFYKIRHKSDALARRTLQNSKKEA